MVYEEIYNKNYWCNVSVVQEHLSLHRSCFESVIYKRSSNPLQVFEAIPWSLGKKDKGSRRIRILEYLNPEIYFRAQIKVFFMTQSNVIDKLSKIYELVRSKI